MHQNETVLRDASQNNKLNKFTVKKVVFYNRHKKYALIVEIEMITYRSMIFTFSDTITQFA